MTDSHVTEPSQANPQRSILILRDTTEYEKQPNDNQECGLRQHTEDTKATHRQAPAKGYTVLPPKRSERAGEKNQDCDLIEGAPHVPFEAALFLTPHRLRISGPYLLMISHSHSALAPLFPTPPQSAAKPYLHQTSILPSAPPLTDREIKTHATKMDPKARSSMDCTGGQPQK